MFSPHVDIITIKSTEAAELLYKIQILCCRGFIAVAIGSPSFEERLHVGRHGGFEIHLFPGVRMPESERSGVQSLTWT